MTAGRPLIIEWYRPDPRRQLTRVCVPAAVAVSLGIMCVAAALNMGTLEPWLRAVLGAIGAGCSVGGPIYAVVGLRRALDDDRYLALRSDGLQVNGRDGSTVVPWAALNNATWDAQAHALRLEIEDADPWLFPQRFAGIRGDALAERICAVQRKALMNLLPRPPAVQDMPR